MNRKFILFMIVSFGTLASCEPLSQTLGIGGKNEDEEQRESLLLAALLLALQKKDSGCSCQIGDTCFSASGGVTCSAGSATGTGTLASTTSSGDFVSLSATITLGAGGSVDFNTGVSSDVSSKTTGATVRTTQPHGYFGSTGSANFGTSNAAAATAGSALTYCFESHVDEGHVMLRSGGCPSSVVTPAAAGNTDDEEGMAGDTGRAWGFILNNATISGVSKNNARTFSG